MHPSPLLAHSTDATGPRVDGLRGARLPEQIPGE